MSRTAPDSFRRLDPLVARALRLLGQRPRRPVPAPDGTAQGRLAEDLAGRLLQEELLVSSWLDVGIWGRPIFTAAAETAVRLQSVAVGGDEVGSGATAEGD